MVGDIRPTGFVVQLLHAIAFDQQIATGFDSTLHAIKDLGAQSRIGKLKKYANHHVVLFGVPVHFARVDGLNVHRHAPLGGQAARFLRGGGCGVL